MKSRKPKVGLVLGAGSARGLAHIGVLQVLNEEQIPFDFIVGSSMGAIVGSIYAAGGDMYMTGKLASSLNYRSFWDYGVPGRGLMSGKRVEELLRLLTKGKCFADLSLPLGVVATDIRTGERIVIDEGPVYKAVRASLSIPGIFEPVRYGNRLLVDGAVSDRLPVGLAWDMGADLVIGVDVTFADHSDSHINSTLDVMLQALEILERQIFENLVRSRISVLVQPRLGNIKSMDFSRAKECIELGREIALENLDEMRRAIDACGETLSSEQKGQLT